MDDASRLRTMAVAAHDEAWRLLEKSERVTGEVEAMIGAAHKSLSLWEQAGGTIIHRQRGNWLIARTYVEAGLAEPALEFARRTMEITAEHHQDLADFDRAFAKEIAARAWALAGDHERAAKHHEGAKMLGERIMGDGDRAAFFRQFERGPWFGLAAAAPPDMQRD
jgi:hypothetical protein